MAQKEKELEIMSEKITCVECGTEMPASSKYCSNCGTAVPYETELKEEETLESEEKIEDVSE